MTLPVVISLVGFRWKKILALSKRKFKEMKTKWLKIPTEDKRLQFFQTSRKYWFTLYTMLTTIILPIAGKEAYFALQTSRDKLEKICPIEQSLTNN